MHTCPTCNGTKKQTITSKTFVGGKGFISDPPVTIDCIICDGVGEIDDETLQQIEFEKNLWNLIKSKCLDTPLPATLVNKVLTVINSF